MSRISSQEAESTKRTSFRVEGRGGLFKYNQDLPELSIKEDQLNEMNHLEKNQKEEAGKNRKKSNSEQESTRLDTKEFFGESSQILIKEKIEEKEKKEEKEKEEKKEKFNQNEKPEEWNERLRKFFIGFELDEQDVPDLINYFTSGQLEEIYPYVKKKKLPEFKEKISALFNEHQNQNNLQTKLIQCLKDFDIDEEDQEDCLELILKGDKKYSKKVHKSYRNLLQNNIQEILKNNSSKSTEKIQEKKKSLLSLNVIFGNNNQFFEIEKNFQEIRKILKIRFAVTCENEYSFYYHEKLLKNLDELQQLEEEFIVLKIEKKIQIWYEHHQSLDLIRITKNFEKKEIKSSIVEKISEKQKILEEKIDLIFQFESEKTKNFETLQKSQLKYGKLKKITVERLLPINIYYQAEMFQLQLQSSLTIDDLQLKIEEKAIPKQAQSIKICEKQIYLTQNDKNKPIFKFLNQKNQISFRVINSLTKQFYGFHRNYKLDFKSYSKFQIQNEEQIITTIKSSNFSDPKIQNIFFKTFITSLFSSMKKRFSIKTIINKFKKMVAKYKYEEIWIPLEENRSIKMNEYFVFQYILFNSDDHLRIQIMNLMKNMMAMPLFFTKFNHIMDISADNILNEQLIWNLKSGITICSIGLHSQLSDNEKGKSDLINKLFFTNFVLSQEKHKIIEEIPYISIRVYDDLFPLNIIDVPHKIDKKVEQKILSCCNLLIVHSWKTQEQSIQFKNKIEAQYKTTVLLFQRDFNQNKVKQLKILEQTNLQKQNSIKIPNLSNSEMWGSYIDMIRGKINCFLKQLNLTSQQKLRCFSLFNNEEFMKFEELLKEFQQEELGICSFFENISLLKQQDQNPEFKKVLKRGLNTKIKHVLSFLQKSNIEKEILLLFLRQRIRTIQNQIMAKYMRIYKFKQKVQKLERQKNQNQFQIQVEKIHELFIPLKQLYTKQNYFLSKDKNDILSIFEKMTFFFENTVKQKIFSIQLFWRQIYSFYKFSKKGKIEMNQSIFQGLTDLKSTEILSNQPFEIIDGDTLQLPSDIMKKVFQPLEDRCLVLTILGPQSSGKSTLLNFLFGCDFSTSQGRCTRGVYGTFFRFDDRKISNLDGIFVMDTEGLFSVTNEKDSEKEVRGDFDSKLVLFCLAVSDFVIINVRGNLDHNTEKILRICYEKLEELNLPKEQRPEIVIVLNQNNTSKTDESQHQFKKIRKTLNFNVAKSLSSAYQIRNYTHKDISLFSENEILSKKVPSQHFLEQTTQLLQTILEKMKEKQNIEKIFTKIDKFSLIWSTVLEFPHLSKLTSKQYNKLQIEIKQWKKIQDEQFNSNFTEIINRVANEIIDSSTAYNQIQGLNLEYLSKYDCKYQIEKFQSDLKILISQERKQIILMNQRNDFKIRYHILKLELKRQLNKQKFQGDSLIREKEMEIIRNQSNNFRTYTKEQKIKTFNSVFEKALQKIKKSLQINSKKNDQYVRIQSEYNLLLKSNPIFVQGLTNKELINLKEIQDLSFEEFKQKILNKIIEKQITDVNLISHIQQPYTNTLVESKTDATLQYLNVKQYFTQQNQPIEYCIYKADLLSHFNIDEIFSKYEMIIENDKNSSVRKQRLKNIFNETNDAFQNKYGFQMKNYSQFEENYYRGEKYWFTRLFQPPSPIEIKYIKKQKNSNFTSYFVKRQCYDIYRNSKKDLYEIEHIQKNLYKNISWKQINVSLQVAETRNPAKNVEIVSQLNKDLNKINLSLRQSFDFSELREPSIKNVKQFISNRLRLYIQELKEERQIENYQQYLNNFSELNYFFGHDLKGKIKIKEKENCKYGHYDLYRLGFSKRIKMKAKQRQFEGYIENQYQKVGKQFKSYSFRQFIHTELTTKGKIELFFNKILKIIHSVKKNWEQFNSSAITQVYNRINEEITLFNNDLNQVSYCLTKIFIGRVHLLVIYIIWKYEIDRIKVIENQPYIQKLKNKENELEKFLLRTSSDLDSILNEEVDFFVQNLEKAFKSFIDKEKQNYFNHCKKDFHLYYNRKQLQKKIDLSIFDRQKNTDKILEYIENPADVIQEEYEKLYQQTWDHKVKYHFEKKKTSQIFLKDIMNLFRQLNQNLENIDKIFQEKGGPSEIFQMIGEASKEDDYEENAKYALFQYILDHILQDDPIKVRNCIDVKLIVKKQLASLGSLQKETVQVLYFLKRTKANLKITNLPKFVKKFILEENQQKLNLKISEEFSLKNQEKKNFINQIRIVICKQKCPCCRRICGVEGLHNYHKCLYGHQMRAFAGNYIHKKNGIKEAFVARCEQLKQTDLVQFNGNKMTWTKFKAYWCQKQPGGWLYDDAIDSIYPQNKKRFEQAWLLAGPSYCKKKDIQFVHYNSAESQLELNENIHLIFALDESFSMEGNKWLQLMKALKETMSNLKVYAGNSEKINVSIINFESNYRIIYERENVANIDISKIEYQGGTTDFQPVFQAAYNITNKNIKNQIILFIFMTDGYADYPTIGIERFEQILNKYPKRFIYSGIEFTSDNNVMKNIQIALKGKNFVANNLDELLKAYNSAIEVIAHKEYYQ